VRTPFFVGLLTHIGDTREWIGEVGHALQASC